MNATPFLNQTQTSNGTSAETASLSELFSDIVKGSTTLAEQHLELSKLEIKQLVSKVVSTVVTASIAIGLFVISWAFLMVTVAHLVMRYVNPEPWVGYLVSTLLCAIPAAVALAYAVTRWRDLNILKNTKQEIREDITWMENNFPART